MSAFSVPVVSIRAIEPIPNADAIELAVVGDYRSVVRKGQFQPGDVAIYIPEAAVVPDDLLERLGLVGKLSGAKKNRVKAIKLRGCLSQGILFDGAPTGTALGTDMAPALGIVKHEPPIPASMGGEMTSLFGYTLNYDIENYKKFPDVLADGEEVEFTEKAHGTFCGVGVCPGLDNPDLFGADGFVYSKGLGSKGLVFKDNSTNDKNIYIAMARELHLHRRIREAFPGRTVHVLGEVYGKGVQDLTYGRPDRSLVVFDINIDGRYLCRDELAEAVAALGLARVPVLYRGPFSREALYQHTDGKTELGNGAHIREGIVVTPAVERRDDAIGRVILKSVSGDYLTRKGDVTEFA